MARIPFGGLLPRKLKPDRPPAEPKDTSDRIPFSGLLPGEVPGGGRDFPTTPTAGGDSGGLSGTAGAGGVGGVGGAGDDNLTRAFEGHSDSLKIKKVRKR